MIHCDSETQSRSESCVFSFSNPILYTALHKCVLSTLQQCWLQLLMIKISIYIYILFPCGEWISRSAQLLEEHSILIKSGFHITQDVLRKCKPYNKITKKCSLCLYEKFIIICKKDLCSLNKRNELATSCPHRNRYVLKNLKIT